MAPAQQRLHLLAAVVAASADASAIVLARGPVRHAASAIAKIAAHVVEWKTKVMLHLPGACPHQAMLRLVLERISRLVI